MNDCKSCQRYDECAGVALLGIVQQPCEQYAPKSQVPENIHTYPKMNEVIKDLLRRSDEPMNRYILALIEELEKRVEELASRDKSKWIGTEDRMPNPGQEVLLWKSRSPYDLVGFHVDIGVYSPEVYQPFWDYTTHWMPTPDPPKGDDVE